MIAALSVQADNINHSGYVIFDIPRQGADSALTKFAEQADLTLIFSFDEVKGITANRLVGKYPVEEAIQILLARTGLTPAMSSKGVLKIINTKQEKSSEAERGSMKTRTIFGSFLAAFMSVPSSAESALEEVVVTAQRREQNLQEVPISITAFTGEAIEKSNINSARDYFALTPNVGFTDDGQSGSKGVGIAVRGVGNLVSGENATVNSIGIYLDDFSIASVPNQVANPTIPDMQGIEVLRGPQGTYFGRNAVGGALNLRTNDPTEEFGYKITVDGEDYEDANDLWRVSGVLNAPLAENFRARAVFMYEDSDGRVKNACAAGASAASCPNAVLNSFVPNGAKNSGHEDIYGRLKAVWDVTPDTTMKLTFAYSDIDQGHDENVPSGILDVDSVDTLGLSAAQDPGTGFYPNNRNTLSHDLREYNENKSYVAILNLQHHFNENFKLASITGVIDAEQDRFFDNDLTGGVDALKRENHYEGTSWSTELRLEYSSERFDWTLGAIYSKDDQEQDNFVAVSSNATATVGNNAPILPPFPEDLGLSYNDKSFEIEEKAIFTDVTYSITDDIDLIAGGRLTYSQVDKSIQSYGIAPTCCFPGSPGYLGPPTEEFFQSFANFIRPKSTGEDDFTDFAPRVGLRYQITDEVNIYSLVSKGYKPGGHSVGNNTNAPGSPAFKVPFDKETLWNYEIGFKSELLDNRLRLNVAAFHLDWSDIQFESFFNLTPGDLSTNFEQFINIPEAKADGIELEFIALLSENLTLSGGFGYIDTEITKRQTIELDGGWQPELYGLDLPKAPRFTASLIGEYRWPIAANEAWVRLEYIHRDGQYSDLEGVTNQQHSGPTPNDPSKVHFVPEDEFPYLSPSYDLFNLTAGFEMKNWRITAYVQNLTDEKYYTGTQENFGTSGIRLRPNPRTIGARVSYIFGGI